MGKPKAGGKKLRRCRPHLTPPEQRKVKRGPLYKKNGPKSRVPVFKPILAVVEYYNRMSGKPRIVNK